MELAGETSAALAETHPQEHLSLWKPPLSLLAAARERRCSAGHQFTHVTSPHAANPGEHSCAAMPLRWASTRCCAAAVIIAIAVCMPAVAATAAADLPAATATAIDGEKVGTVPLPIPPAASLARPLVFQHIQKTGGTTLRQILHDALAAQKRPAVISCHGGLSCYFGLLSHLSSPKQLNRTACAVAFAGHFPSGALGLVSHLAQIDLGLFGPVACRRWPWLERSGVVAGAALSAQPTDWLLAMLQLLGTNTACALMLREPLSRLQSHYYHFVEPTGNVTCLDGSSPPGPGKITLARYLDKCGSRNALAKMYGSLQLSMTSGLGSGDVLGERGVANVSAHLQLSVAKRVIDKCSVVGTTESYSEFLAALQELVGAPMPCSTALHLNTAAGQGHLKPEPKAPFGPPAMAEELRALLSLETELYAHAKAHRTLRGTPCPHIKSSEVQAAMTRGRRLTRQHP